MINNEPQSVQQLIDTIDPETYRKLKTAIELGKWESGDKLTRQQVEYCLQAVIAYESRHVEPAQRVGYIDRSQSKSSQRTDRPDSIISVRTGDPGEDIDN